ncbi:EipB family protein [Acetobacter nitrogenifigens]|uniref:ATP-binding protein n=1 Tax=Acetobacter nitrogenifigens DSM 23921 = NBRC 105050 TaxID=1120919 RepID=A0A511X6G0_9PROT|nr:DUF1849 family protein [Acetobacter nitrogenifigens]GEN58520.1 ATP-binding protein [Acetobacter nitrogenifigens DSM 23921 = NBRC 105050]
MSGGRSVAAVAALAIICGAAPTFAADGISSTLSQARTPGDGVATPAAATAAPAVTASGANDAQISAAPHRAVYDLTLSAVSGGDVVAANGSMTYAVSDACGFWSTEQMLKVQTVSRSGAASEQNSEYSALESKDGRQFQFATTQKSGDETVMVIRGDATLDADGSGVVHYSAPKKKTVTLPKGTLLPMAHTLAILHAAKDGAHDLARPLFDGTGADGAQLSYVSILGWTPLDGPAPFPALSGLMTARVRVAFYAVDPGAMLPDFEMGMRYYANGVSDRLDMDFGDFRMKGSLRSFQPKPTPKRCGAGLH